MCTAEAERRGEPFPVPEPCPPRGTGCRQGGEVSPQEPVRPRFSPGPSPASTQPVAAPRASEEARAVCLREEGGRRSFPGTSVPPGRYSPLSARPGSERGQASSAGHAPERCVDLGAATSAPLPLRPPGPPADGRSRGGAGGAGPGRGGVAAREVGRSLSRLPRPARLERLRPWREGAEAKGPAAGSRRTRARARTTSAGPVLGAE